MIFDSAYERGDYDRLYANYLGAEHENLAVAVRQHCKEQEPEIAVDLCAGTGHMALHLLDCGVPTVFAVDKAQAMLDRIQPKLPRVYRVTRNFETWCIDLNATRALETTKQALPVRIPQGVELVTCRQGIGYLNSNTLHEIPSKLLAPGGSFLFNTFIEPPANQLWWHNRGDGIHEAGFYVGGSHSKIYHAQLKWPRFDLTTFDWHDIEKVHTPAWMKTGYRVEIKKYNRTLIVRVERPL